MSRRPATVTQAEVARAVRGARAGGIDVAEVRISGDQIIIRAKSAVPPAANDGDDLDSELKQFEAEHGDG